MSTNIHHDPQRLLRNSGVGTALYALISAFSMFSIIPMPELNWDEDRSRWLLAAFPAVGFVLGLLLLLVKWLLHFFPLSPIIPGALLTILGIVLTGAIHMDGFGDVLDAVFSHRGREEELRIMKDPHSGSMAVVGIGLFLLAEFSIFAELQLQITARRQFLSLPFILALERCLSAYLLLRLPRVKNSRMGAMIADAAPPQLPAFLLAQAAVCGLALLIIQGFAAFLLIGTAALLSYAFARFCLRRYEGMNGDLAGFFLCLEELLYLFLWMLISF